jgi:hypothetical protein
MGVCTVNVDVADVSHTLPTPFAGIGQAPIAASESIDRQDWLDLVRALGAETFRLSSGHIDWNTTASMNTLWGVLQSIADDLLANGAVKPKLYISGYVTPVGAPISGLGLNPANYQPKSTGNGSTARVNEFLNHWLARWGAGSIEYFEPYNEPAIHGGKTSSGGGVGFWFSSNGSDRTAADWASVHQRTLFNAAQVGDLASIPFGSFVYASGTAPEMPSELNRFTEGTPISGWPWGGDNNGFYDSLTWHAYGGTTAGSNHLGTTQNLLNAVYSGVNANGSLAFSDPRVRTFYGAAAAKIREHLDSIGLTATKQRMGEFGPYFFGGQAFAAHLEAGMLIASCRWQDVWKLDGVVMMGLRRTPFNDQAQGDKVIWTLSTGSAPYVGGPRYWQYRQMGFHFCRDFKRILACSRTFTNTTSTPTTAASGGNAVGQGQLVVGLHTNGQQVGIWVQNVDQTNSLTFQANLGFVPSGAVSYSELPATLALGQSLPGGTFAVSGTSFTRTIPAGTTVLYKVPVGAQQPPPDPSTPHAGRWLVSLAFDASPASGPPPDPGLSVHLGRWITGVQFDARALAVPANITLPLISGTAQAGETLFCTSGTWTESPTGYAYQWQRDNDGGGAFTNITGASLSTYEIDEEDVGSRLRCIVTATNAIGAIQAVSDDVAAIDPGWGTYTSALVTRVSTWLNDEEVEFVFPYSPTSWAEVWLLDELSESYLITNET